MDFNRTYNEVLDYLKNNLNEKRFRHILGVEKEAVKLGMKYDENIEKCRIAAVCHDCLKNSSYDDLLFLIKKYNMELDSIQLNSPQILHGPVGAEFCRENFKIEDAGILNAVAYHTTGRANMSLLEKIIYISDLIEEGRDFQGINEIRKKAYIDLDDAVLSACNETIIYVVNKNELLHPLTIELRNSLIMRSGENIG
jgi:predicted HD superfamily hydrolase involved in NAD metabolism